MIACSLENEYYYLVFYRDSNDHTRPPLYMNPLDLALVIKYREWIPDMKQHPEWCISSQLNRSQMSITKVPKEKVLVRWPQKFKSNSRSPGRNCTLPKNLLS